MFKVIDQFKRTIVLSKERYEHIIEHPEMIGQEDRIKETIAFPDTIKESKYDTAVFCYYRLYEKTPVTRKYLLCIVKILNGEGFIITAFYTDRIKEGKALWKRWRYGMMRKGTT